MAVIDPLDPGEFVKLYYYFPFVILITCLSNSNVCAYLNLLGRVAVDIYR
jgi:hypothetical protein